MIGDRVRQSMLNKMILAFTLLASSSAMARQFDIEIILFKRNMQPNAANEIWPEELSAINYNNTLDISDKSAMSSKGATPLSSGSKYLKRQYEALRNHAGFTPLSHMVWRQGDQGKRSAPTLHIQNGQNYGDQYFANGLSKAANPTLVDSPLSETVSIDFADFNDPSLPQLEGKIQVYVQHYLFVEAQLDLRIPSRQEVVIGSHITDGNAPLTLAGPEEDTLSFDADDITLAPLEDAAIGLEHLQRVEATVEVQDYLKTYRMDQRRRMRSGETHYLDHPLMGMIIQVRRVGSADNSIQPIDLDGLLEEPSPLLANVDHVESENEEEEFTAEDDIFSGEE